MFASLEQNVSFSFSCIGTGYLLFSMYVLLGFGLSAGSDIPACFNFVFLSVINLQAFPEYLLWGSIAGSGHY